MKKTYYLQIGVTIDTMTEIFRFCVENQMDFNYNYEEGTIVVHGTKSDIEHTDEFIRTCNGIEETFDEDAW